MALNKHLISGLAATAIVASVGLAYAQTGNSASTGQGPVSQETQPAGSSSPATQPSSTDTSTPSSTGNSTASPSSSDMSTTTPSGTVNMTEPAPQADRN